MKNPRSTHPGQAWLIADFFNRCIPLISLLMKLSSIIRYDLKLDLVSDLEIVSVLWDLTFS